GLLALTWLECSCSRAIPDLRTFPTRRSSDLVERQRFVERASQQRVALSLARRFSLAAAGTKPCQCRQAQQAEGDAWNHPRRCTRDRKSTRLNSSHVKISYAVFCLKKKRTDRD